MDPLTSPLRPIDRLLRPVQFFTGHRLSGAFLLMAGAVTAVVWANSPWAHVYHELLETRVSVGFGELALDKTLHHWINDGLMGVFFFLVGLEIKREVLAGELSSVRQASLPAIAAVGGMVAPALVYLAFNPGGPASQGWGVPMATDIAFALGVLALLGDRVPLGLKVFLTALAIVDDIGAVLVIAVFYTSGVSIFSLVAGLLLLGVAMLANRLEVRNSLAYFVLGVLVWLAFLQSGVHATIAALLMAFTIPSRTRLDGAAFLQRIEHQVGELRASGVPEDHSLNTPDQQHALDAMAVTLHEASAPLQRLEHALNPIVTFVVLPVFALANAGVEIGAGIGTALTEPLTLGIIAGLFVGKQVGIGLASWVAVKAGVADLPSGVTWGQVWGVSILGGIGFTMSLFVASLAFADPVQLEHAKIGILAASIVSGAVGLLVVRVSTAAPVSGA